MENEAAITHSPSPRRSPRKSSSPFKVHVITNAEELEADSELRRVTRSRSASVSPSKRKSATANGDGNGSPTKKPKLGSTKRGFAPAELYSHLHLLPDHLDTYLDVVFCGINPGQKSAEEGHHFAHPTNQFWACLNLAGFTPTKLPAQEDFTLPGNFSLGLTNLVDRPTASESELSTAEQIQSVPTFLSKISRWRPRIVCFVGMGIARIVHADQKLGLGLSNSKIVHPEDSVVKETLFFTVPSTSGLVSQYPLATKTKWFKTLHECLQNVKTGAEGWETANMKVLLANPVQKIETEDILRASS